MSTFRIKEFPSLTAVLHKCLLRHPSLNGKVLADLVDREYQTMMSELSRQPGHKLGADMLLPLMDGMDTDYPLIFLCRERNGVFVPLPQAPIGEGSLYLKLAETIREASEFFSQTAEAIADGVVDVEELARIEKEGHEAIEAILYMMKAARVAHEQRFK